MLLSKKEEILEEKSSWWKLFKKPDLHFAARFKHQ